MSITPGGDYQPETPIAPEPAPRRARSGSRSPSRPSPCCASAASEPQPSRSSPRPTRPRPPRPRANNNGFTSPFGHGNRFGNGGLQGGQSIGQQATADEAPATPATDAQKVGVVTIDTCCRLQPERAGGRDRDDPDLQRGHPHQQPRGRRLDQHHASPRVHGPELHGHRRRHRETRSRGARARGASGLTR